jgi:amidohydrolase
MPLDAKAGARESLESTREQLVALSHRIHAVPELGYEEEHAAGWLCDLLSDAGFRVERGICDIPTAFRASAGSGPLHVSICAEYDALPAIGHACGHNIIAAMSAGAGIAAARVADEAGLTVTVVGTPAEEVGNVGGKILMLERGAFDDAHAAMMVHPAPFDGVTPPLIAAALFDVRYTGKESHAAAFPEMGINAADALTIAQTAIGLIRQHIRPSDRIHGIITHGGDAPNVVPAHTTAKYMVRASTIEELTDVRDKVFRCFQAGALATGAKLEIVGGEKPYAQVVHEAAIAELYRRNAERTGRIFPEPGDASSRVSASTDMGNVSLAIPSIHPMIGIDSLPAVNHQPEFTVHCATPSADQAIWDGALAMAWTAIDMARIPAVRDRLLARGTGPRS